MIDSLGNSRIQGDIVRVRKSSPCILRKSHERASKPKEIKLTLAAPVTAPLVATQAASFVSALSK